MPRSAGVPAELRFTPFRGRDAVARGLLTRRQLCGSCWRRLLPDVYLHRDVELDHLSWCTAARLVLPPRGAIGGASAAFLYGADVLALDPPVEVCVPREMRLWPHPRLRVRRGVLSDSDVRRVGGLPVTRPVRTAFDLARRPDLVEAVVGVDALLHRRLVTLEQLRDYTAERPGWPGARQIRKVLELAQAGAESPMETRLRLLVGCAGLPSPLVQHEVFDGYGRFVARLDLAYPGVRLGVEYDGDHHRERATFRRDVARLNALHGAGWTVLRFTADDVLRNPDNLVAQVRAATTARGRSAT